MTIEVLGLGESLSNYKPKGNITIGVNDIFKYHAVDHLVLLDPPFKFNPERLKTICESTPKIFHSHKPEWATITKSIFRRITLTLGGRGKLKQLDGPDFCYSNNSPYVACVLAYKLGAKKIILHGADFNTHKSFNDPLKKEMLQNAIKDFKNLFDEFSKRKVYLSVGSEASSLSQVIPVERTL